MLQCRRLGVREDSATRPRAGQEAALQYAGPREPLPNGLRLPPPLLLLLPGGGSTGELALPWPGTVMLCPPGSVMLIEPFGPKLMPPCPPCPFWLPWPPPRPWKKPKPFGSTTKIQLAVVDPSRVATSALSFCASAAAPCCCFWPLWGPLITRVLPSTVKVWSPLPLFSVTTTELPLTDFTVPPTTVSVCTCPFASFVFVSTLMKRSKPWLSAAPMPAKPGSAPLPCPPGRAGMPAAAASPSVTVRFWALPPRLIASATLSPGCLPPSAFFRSMKEATLAPFTAVITSPCFTPAFSAGPPATTEATVSLPLSSCPESPR